MIFTGMQFAGRCMVALLLCALLGACASLPKNVDRQASSTYTDTDDTALGKAIHDDLADYPGMSGFNLLVSGLDAFAARALLANQAERSIDAQYYLFHDDLVGRLFVHALLQAADRGVRVRLLVDDMALDDDKDIAVAALDAHPMVEIRVFNPFARNSARWLQMATRFDVVTRRMHNKSFTVDNQITVVGGRNIGNEYYEADPDLVFGDLDLLAIGPVVGKVSASFDLYWNSESSYPVSLLAGGEDTAADLDRLRARLSDYAEQHHDSAYLEALRTSDLVNSIREDRLRMYWGHARVIYDDPAKVTEARDQTHLHLAPNLVPIRQGIEHELTIFSPYFVPGRQGVANLVELRERGVRVRILTNSLASTDVAAVHAGYAKYRKYLLRAGVELYEIDKVLTAEQRRQKAGVSGSSKASLHTKSFIIDREQVFVGSMNLDPRSVVENTEIGIIVDCPEIAAGMAGWFDLEVDKVAFRVELEKNARGEEQLVWYRRIDDEELRFTTEPNTGFWRRFGVGLLGFLPIEPLL